ncbi:hypothetical protein AXE85_06795 [Gemella sp. oral taxon 928]|uniref:YhgE/Pip domain-containing protein n=1 Tax=Gemella sp. oral taxon 928 TaxID=1785995 RepID=UPI000768398D|nr:YhgE/Pip domain-containing protein [Gemella sp. oral taxon 928]AME09875.1 hypothetical protein AXE85_06795 [Gemella sp. oral taxon 928]
MKNIFQIFRNDIKEIFRKTRTWLIIIGLMVLPSMYAWPNILSSWDPYGHTNQIKVAVVSEDKGATVENNKINLGKNLIEGLKNNKNLDWQFVETKAQAEDGVKIGDYYASIVIPENFTKDLTSITRGTPEKATIEYTVNEKINAISPKITNSGASAIANNISKSFVETANGIIFEKLHEAGIKFEENLPSIEKTKEEILKLNDNFSNYESALNELINKVERGQNIISAIHTTLPEVDKVATNSIMLADKAEIAISNIEGFNAKLLPKISEHLSEVENISKDAHEIALEFQNKPTKKDELKAKMKTLDSRFSTGIQRLELVKNIFSYFNKLSGENLFNNQLNRVNNLIADIEKISELNKNFYNNIDKYDEITTEAKERFVEGTQSINETAYNFNQGLNGEVAPLIENVLSKAKVNAEKFSNIIYEAQGELPIISNKLSEAEMKVNMAHNKLLTLSSEMPTIKEKIKKLSEEIKEAEGKVDTNSLFNLLKVDYKKQAEFFANPVNLQENKLYHISNYGSAMTPFYTVLSIWVGSLLISSLLTTKVEDKDKKYKPYEKYFGRWLLFMIIALFQSMIVTLGDMYVLGTQAVSPYRFVVYGLLIALLFSSIIYTLVYIFGNIGKALCIILLVLQLGSSGGTFPIQMTAKFFQTLYPKVPFTYSIGLLREAVGGVYIPAVERDMKILLTYLVIVLVIGVIAVSLIAKSERLSRERGKSKLFL